MKTVNRSWFFRRMFQFFLVLFTKTTFDQQIECTGFHLSKSRGLSETAEDIRHLYDVRSMRSNNAIPLEELIYSDVINNIKSFVKAENHSKILNETEQNNNGEKFGERNGERLTNLQNFINYSKSLENALYFNGSNDVRKSKKNLYFSGNVTFDNSDDHPYLLSYSGDPFRSPKAMAKIVESRMKQTSENETETETDMRKKRSVVHLYNMVLCATGCNPFSYKGYGCYCGFLGSGFVKDGIDSCCKMHDWCYNSAGCPMFLEYFIPYLWKCYNGQPLCAIDHGEYGGTGSCAQRLCECDRQLALCLRKYSCPRTKALCTSSPWRLLQNIFMLR